MQAHASDFEAIFHEHPDIADYNKLPTRLQQYADKIHEIGTKAHISHALHASF